MEIFLFFSKNKERRILCCLALPNINHRIVAVNGQRTHSALIYGPGAWQYKDVMPTPIFRP
jgi:hypothetical protein